jgi:hypothetical protein
MTMIHEAGAGVLVLLREPRRTAASDGLTSQAAAKSSSHAYLT